MPFESVVHLLLPVVVATVPLFFPTISEATPSNWNIHILYRPKRLPAVSNNASKLLQPTTNTATARATRQYERQRQFPPGGRAIGEWKRERICSKQTKKMPRESTRKIEEKKKTGPKGKVGKGPVWWVRPLCVHVDNDHLMQCSPPSLAATPGEKGV